MQEGDLRLLHEWLQRPHVRRWWTEHETYEEVVDHHLPAIEGADPTDLYFVMLDGRPVGFIQTYLVSDYPDYASLVDAGDGVAGVDLFIAEVDLIGCGIGTETLRRFVSDVVFADPATGSCLADPDAENAASVRAFEKAGFRVVARLVDPSDGKLHALVQRDRP